MRNELFIIERMKLAQDEIGSGDPLTCVTEMTQAYSSEVASPLLGTRCLELFE